MPEFANRSDLEPPSLSAAEAAPTAEGILTTLRRATAQQHRRLDHDPSLAQLLHPHVALAHYWDVLAAFYGFYAPLEAALQGCVVWDDVGLVRDTRRKTPLLAADLACSRREVAGLPLCTQLPPCRTPAQAAGIIYVLEGSTLGGRMIARHVHAALGLTADAGLAFFSSYRDQVDPMWAATRTALARAAARYQDDSAMVAGAQATFACLSAWLVVCRSDTTA